MHARHCVDEVIKHTVSRYEAPDLSSKRGTPGCPDHDGSPYKARMPLAIQVLIDLHSRLDSSLAPHSQHPQPLLEAMDGHVYSPAPHLANDSGLDMDLLASILDLEA